jgi:hypothetical protein
LNKDPDKEYSTDYRDLNIDVYKELWNLVKDILILLDYDMKKLEDEIFSPPMKISGLR